MDTDVVEVEEFTIHLKGRRITQINGKKREELPIEVENVTTAYLAGVIPKRLFLRFIRRSFNNPKRRRT